MKTLVATHKKTNTHVNKHTNTRTHTSSADRSWNFLANMSCWSSLGSSRCNVCTIESSLNSYCMFRVIFFRVASLLIKSFRIEIVEMLSEWKMTSPFLRSQNRMWTFARTRGSGGGGTVCLGSGEKLVSTFSFPYVLNWYNSTSKSSNKTTEPNAFCLWLL